MHEEISLIQALQDTMQQAYEANEAAYEAGIERAQAEQQYREALARKVEALRREKAYPVSIAQDIAKGSHEVTQAARRRDEAEELRETKREEVMLRKREADILRDHIQRDYAVTK